MFDGNSHAGVASMARFRTSNTLVLNHVRRTCTHVDSDGNKCKTQIKDKEKNLWGGMCRKHGMKAV